jgi:hypothetical protein
LGGLLSVALVGAASMPAGHLSASGRRTSTPAATSTVAGTESRAVLDKYCVTCHNEKMKTGGLALEYADLTDPNDTEVWEKILTKLDRRAMPPLGAARPDEAAYKNLTALVTTTLDARSAGSRAP